MDWAQRSAPETARVTRAVIAGRLAPLQGAEQLCDLHSVNPYFKWKPFRNHYSGEPDLARCGQQLQTIIDAELARNASQSEALASEGFAEEPTTHR